MLIRSPFVNPVLAGAGMLRAGRGVGSFRALPGVTDP